MSSSSNKRMTALIALLAIGLLLTFPIGAEEAKEETKEKSSPKTFAEIGRALDEARLLTEPDRRSATENVARSLEALLESDIPKDKRCAVHFLGRDPLHTRRIR